MKKGLHEDFFLPEVEVQCAFIFFKPVSETFCKY